MLYTAGSMLVRMAQPTDGRGAGIGVPTMSMYCRHEDVSRPSARGAHRVMKLTRLAAGVTNASTRIGRAGRQSRDHVA